MAVEDVALLRSRRKVPMTRNGVHADGVCGNTHFPMRTPVCR